MTGAFSKAIVLCTAILLLTACTASDWISAAGGIAEARDGYKKQQTMDKIRAANKAASKK